jgi:predicted nucleic acid-binding protein
VTGRATACVLVTDAVIAALDRSDAHHVAAARALRRMARDGVPLLLSLMNYAESLVRPAEDPTALRAAVAAVDALGIRLVAPTPGIARDAAVARALGVSLADGFALATARAHSAQVGTFDKRVRRAARRAGAELAPGFG